MDRNPALAFDMRHIDTKVHIILDFERFLSFFKISSIWNGRKILNDPDHVSYRALFGEFQMGQLDCLTVRLWIISARFDSTGKIGTGRKSDFEISLSIFLLSYKSL